jgi:hypothetical protein
MASVCFTLEVVEVGMVLVLEKLLVLVVQVAVLQVQLVRHLHNLQEQMGNQIQVVVLVVVLITHQQPLLRLLEAQVS